MGDSHKKCPKTVLLIQMIVIYSFIDQFLKFLIMLATNHGHYRALKINFQSLI